MTFVCPLSYNGSEVFCKSYLYELLLTNMQCVRVLINLSVLSEYPVVT